MGLIAKEWVKGKRSRNGFGCNYRLNNCLHVNETIKHAGEEQFQRLKKTTEERLPDIKRLIDLFTGTFAEKDCVLIAVNTVFEQWKSYGYNKTIPQAKQQIETAMLSSGFEKEFKEIWRPIVEKNFPKN